ncbi:MAG: cell division protein FtsL [Lachnospiraceae bacterium]|nr:cell division protein FtsL [Lachnospiraceae bacterium]
MSRNSRMEKQHRQTTYDRDSRNRRDIERNGGSDYVYGNVVRKAEPERRWEETPVRKPHPEVKKNREKVHHMNAGYVFFLTGALCMSAFILVNFIQTQAELTTLTKIVANKESELNHLKRANDEEYNRITNSIDLEEIKRIAMGELGMVYAQEGQIITYESERNDYMRQVK